MKSMEWVHKEFGIQTEKPCPDCSQELIRYQEMDLDYLFCPNADCQYLKIIESKDIPIENIQRWFILGLFNLESIAREHDTGYVSKAIWKHIMQLEASSLETEIEQNLLDRIWNANLSKCVRKLIQIEKAKNNLN